jgi:hypothetical protein
MNRTGPRATFDRSIGKATIPGAEGDILRAKATVSAAKATVVPEK